MAFNPPNPSGSVVWVAGQPTVVGTQGPTSFVFGGTNVITGNGGARYDVPFGFTFPNAVASVVALNGDWDAANFTIVGLDGAHYTLTTFRVVLSGNLPAAQPMRINWIAFGS
jgi:hypothetical protein